MSTSATNTDSNLFFERARHIEQTGRWWEPAWWQRPGELPDAVTSADFEEVVARIRAVFDDEWFLAQRQSHPFAFSLMNTGTTGIGDLMLVARGLTALDGALGDTSSVVARLRSPSEYQGARREILVASLLAESGLRCRFPETNCAGADLHTVGATPEFAVEVTGVDRRDADRRMAEFIGRASRLLGDLLSPRGYDADLSGDDVLEVIDARTFESVCGSLLSRITSSIKAHPQMETGQTIEIPGIGRVKVTDAIGGRAGGPAIDLERMAAKLASVLAAKEPQLPTDRPGVIAVEFPFGLVRLAEVTLRLEQKLLAHRPKTDRIAGIVFFTLWHDADGVHFGLSAHDNPYASVPLRDLPWPIVNGHGRPGAAGS